MTHENRRQEGFRLQELDARLAPDWRANWREWKFIPEVSARDACLLSLNLNPHKIQAGQMNEATDYRNRNSYIAGVNRHYGEEYRLRLRVLKAHLANEIPQGTRNRLFLGAVHQTEPVRLCEFAAWAMSVGWDIPDELAALAQAPETETAAPVAPVKVSHDGTASEDDKPEEANDWKAKCREIADELDAIDAEAGAWSSITDLSERIAPIAIERKIRGPHGQLSAGNIRREALQGNRWMRRRDKPKAA